MEIGICTNKTTQSQIFRSLGLEEGHEKLVSCMPPVLRLLGSVLERTVRKNERSYKERLRRRENVTIFHGSRAPSMSIQQYIERIYKYTCCSPSCFVMAYVYIQRYLERTEVRLTWLNVHRLLVTSVMLAAKFMDECVITNAYYAKVGGVSNAEMNRLELKLLFDLDFVLNVTKEAFEKYCLQVEREGGKACHVEPLNACGLREGRSNKYTTRYASKGSACSCQAI